MRKLPYRSKEITPKTTVGIASAGNASASTLKAAATVVVTDLARGADHVAPANPKAKASPTSKASDKVERKKQREVLRLTVSNWENIHNDNIKGCGEPDQGGLDEL